MTDFEMEQGQYWDERYAQLQSLCFQVLRFMQENKGIASKIEITENSIHSFI